MSDFFIRIALSIAIYSIIFHFFGWPGIIVAMILGV